AGSASQVRTTTSAATSVRTNTPAPRVAAEKSTSGSVDGAAGALGGGGGGAGGAGGGRGGLEGARRGAGRHGGPLRGRLLLQLLRKRGVVPPARQRLSLGRHAPLQERDHRFPFRPRLRFVQHREAHPGDRVRLVARRVRQVVGQVV